MSEESYRVLLVVHMSLDTSYTVQRHWRVISDMHPIEPYKYSLVSPCSQKPDLR